jgi:hypothetical protein
MTLITNTDGNKNGSLTSRSKFCSYYERKCFKTTIDKYNKMICLGERIAPLT